MNKANILLILLVVFCLACEEKDCCTVKGEIDEVIKSSWLLYESGYSPGNDYVTIEVPAEPPQVISFGGDNKFSSDVDGWSKYKFYLIADDPHNAEEKIVALFETDPGNTVPTVFQTSFSIKLQEDKLVLRYRWCTEGCHSAFKRLE